MRHHRRHHHRTGVPGLARGPQTPGVPRLRFGGDRHRGQRRHRAPPRRGQARQPRGVVGRQALAGAIGIGHTRWATHGAATERNAHPHATEHVAVVHNGIIENFRELRQELTAAGRTFVSETDSEVIAHLISDYIGRGMAPFEATQAALARLDGAFALGVVFAGEHELLIGARRGSPLCIGWGEGEMYLGSDALALGPLSERISYLEEGDCAALSRTGAVVRDSEGNLVERPARVSAHSGALIGKGNHPPLYGQGDPRAAERDRRDAERLLRPGEPLHPAARASLRPGRGAQDHDPRLRHLVLRRPDRQILVRAHRKGSGRGRYRVRVPLPRAAHGVGRATLVISHPARPPTRLRRCVSPARRARTPRPSSMSRRARSRANPMSSSAFTPGPNWASPRPRPSPANWWRWPAS